GFPAVPPRGVTVRRAYPRERDWKDRRVRLPRHSLRQDLDRVPDPALGEKDGREIVEQARQAAGDRSRVLREPDRLPVLNGRPREPVLLDPHHAEHPVGGRARRIEPERQLAQRSGLVELALAQPDGTETETGVPVNLETESRLVVPRGPREIAPRGEDRREVVLARQAAGIVRDGVRPERLRVVPERHLAPGDGTEDGAPQPDHEDGDAWPELRHRRELLQPGDGRECCSDGR